MCTGRVDPAFILRAFSNGADGVYVGGCWPGECHYTTEGNYHTLGTMLLMKKLMKYVCLNPDRLRVEWVGASEGIRFADVMNDVSAKIKEIGPLGKSEGIDEKTLKFKFEAVRNLLPYIKLVEKERLGGPFATAEEYSRFFASDEAERLFRELVADKLAVSQIMLLLGEGRRLSGGEISNILGLDPSDVTRYLNSSARQGLMRFDEKQNVFLPPGVKEQARA
jgi:F420-non-reducing hydrogenase iron-sulfur subunit